MASTIPYEKITNTLIEALENCQIPWHKPWKCGGPMNAFSKRAYKGINSIVLGFARFSDPRWATFKQIAEHGGSVKKGQKSTPIVFWAFVDAEDKATGEKRRVPFLKYFNVFNVEQTEGLNLKLITDLGNAH